MSKHLLFSIVLLIVFSCNQKDEPIPETATSGTLKIAFDDSYLPIVKQEKAIFQYLYKYATVTDTVLPQEKAHELFLKDSVKMIFSSRSLNKYETNYLKSRKVFPKIYEFAQDGLVLVVNPNSKDSIITFEMLKRIVSGDGSSVSLVVDNSLGSSISSFVSLLGLSNDTIEHVFSAESTRGVIDYVSNNENAIGLLSSVWLSDSDDPKVKSMLGKIRIAKVATAKSDKAYYPFQSEIADSSYPLRRTIYLISRESKMGLANGFASFLLGEKGQRVVLKAGLLPSRMPGREVVFSKKSVYN